MDKQINFKVDSDLAKAFKIALIQRGETAQAVLEKAVIAYVQKN